MKYDNNNSLLVGGVVLSAKSVVSDESFFNFLNCTHFLNYFTTTFKQQTIFVVVVGGRNFTKQKAE